MVARSRGYSVPFTNGTWTRFGDTSGGGVGVIESHSIQDQTGPGDCDQLMINSWKRSGGVISQRDNPGFFGAYFQNYHTDGAVNESNFPHIGVSGVPAAGDSAILGINRTSPSRAYVDVPANLLQLGELTHLLHNAGKNLLQRGAKENLRYQFGIAPLVGDLVKLTRFNDQVDRRLGEFEKLRSARGLRRTVDIGTYEASTVYNLVFQSQGQFSQLPVSAHTEVNVRCHCRWSPADTGISRSPHSMRRLAQRVVLGSSIDFATLWEITPWSWLIDWAYDIGGYLRTQRNSVPAILTKINVMEHTRTTHSAPGWQWPDYGRNQTPFFFERERKQRIVPIVAPSAHFPFLTGNQMGIVASLAIAKAR